MGITVYGTMSIDRIEEKVASAFLQVTREENGKEEKRRSLASTVSSSATLETVASPLERMFEADQRGQFVELLGEMVTSPFHLYRDEPGRIRGFFGARPRIILERGMTTRGYTKIVLDGVVKNLAEQYPNVQVISPLGY